MSVPTRAGMPGPHRAMVGDRAGRPRMRPRGGCVIPRSRKETCPFAVNLVAGCLAWASWHVVGGTHPSSGRWRGPGWNAPKAACSG